MKSLTLTIEAEPHGQRHRATIYRRPADGAASRGERLAVAYRDTEREAVKDVLRQIGEDVAHELGKAPASLALPSPGDDPRRSRAQEIRPRP